MRCCGARITRVFSIANWKASSLSICGRIRSSRDGANAQMLFPPEIAATTSHVLLWNVFTQVLLPILVLMTIGWVLDRKFNLDLGTLVKLNIYLFVPAFI